jgi:hypothetical protein
MLRGREVRFLLTTHDFDPKLLPSCSKFEVLRSLWQRGGELLFSSLSNFREHKA